MDSQFYRLPLLYNIGVTGIADFYEGVMFFNVTNYDVVFTYGDVEERASSCNYSGTGDWIVQSYDGCSVQNVTVVNGGLVINSTGGSFVVNSSLSVNSLSITPGSFAGTCIVSILTNASLVLDKI